MILGIGTDLCRVERMEKSLASPAFWKNVFGPGERQLLESLPPHRRAESAAACFAAKEAFLKAAGLGLGGLPLASIQALRRESGEPYYCLEGPAAALLEEKGATALLSLSHEGGLALAFALLQRRE